MNNEKSGFILLNVIGGAAVLASYVLWLSNSSNDGGALWGSISGVARTGYVISMFAAAAGYFAFFAYLLKSEISPTVWQRLLVVFALILFPSALWMPITFEYLDAPGAALWWAMRITLAIVGIASLALLISLSRLPHDGRAHTLAVAGAAAFVFQTLVLDALVWPTCFPG